MLSSSTVWLKHIRVVASAVKVIVYIMLLLQKARIRLLPWLPNDTRYLIVKILAVIPPIKVAILAGIQ